MRARLLMALATASLVATGCVGSLDPLGTSLGSGGGPPPTSPQPSDTARLAFNTNVYPILSAKCGACHTVGSAAPPSPAFFDPSNPNQDPSQAWTTFTSSTVVGDLSSSTNNPLFLEEGEVVHDANQTFSTAEISTITNWLVLESEWRSAGTAPPDLLKQFSGCLTKTDFDRANMALAWAMQVQTEEGPCEVCHPKGTGYMLATPQDSMFTGITTYREYMMTFFTVDTAANQVVINLNAFETAYHGGLNGQHPGEWTSNDEDADPAGANNAGVNALDLWYRYASARLAAGACGPPTLGD